MRDALIDLLARAILDGRLTEEAAREMLARFDAGAVSESTLSALLPVPPPLAVVPLVAGDETAAALLAAVSGASLAQSLLSGEASGGRVALREQLRLDFQRAVLSLSLMQEKDGLALAEWQVKMSALVCGLMLAQFLAGSGGVPPSAALLQRMDAEAQVQTAYLSRFADTLAVAALQNRPFSPRAILARSLLYGGAGYGFWFHGFEMNHPYAGYIVHYRSRDDSSTCAPCHDAEIGGPYRVGEGPYPGQICRGGGHCRCVRELVYDPKAFAALDS